MKKILFLMAIAMTIQFGAKAQYVTFTLNNSTSTPWTFITLWAMCPDQPNHVYELQLSSVGLTSGKYTYGGPGMWNEVSGAYYGAGLVNPGVTPPCGSMTIIAVDDSCPSGYLPPNDPYWFINNISPTTTSCGYTVSMTNSYYGGVASNTINVY